MSWNDLNTKQKQSHDEKLERLMSLSQSIFNQGQGKEFLKLLQEIYAFMPVCIPGSPLGSNEIREGEIGFVRKLIRWSMPIKE